MSSFSPNGRRSLLSLLAVTCLLAAASGPSIAAKSAPQGGTEAFLVQGVPGAEVAVRVDGEMVRRALPAKAIVGPLDLAAGKHTVTFKSADWTVTSSFNADRPSVDVVLHWPADATDEPEATVFTNIVGAVPPGKGRLTVAHTAVVPPADVRVSGEVLFANIANGEFVTAEVPADTYSVDIVPTGGTSPLLGPVDLEVKAGVLTRVFAIGAPKEGSMDAVVQVLPLRQRGSVSPGSVDTGSAGLVATQPGDTGSDGVADGTQVALAGVVLAGFALVGWVIVRRRHVDG